MAFAQNVADVRRGFENPPEDARIMMRWWWFGPAVTKPELEREMRLMKDGGIGGFEVQPFSAGRTKMMVKRAAAGAEGFVLDHYNRTAIEHHLRAVGEPLLKALGPHPPYAVFSDSLEVFASDWTGDLLEEFQKRRGYDLTPYLPLLVAAIGEKSSAVRCDWGKTLTELTEERYLKPVEDWARAHHTRFRSQTYGTPPVA